MQASKIYGLLTIPGPKGFHTRALQIAYQYVGNFIVVFSNNDQVVFVHFIFHQYR
jgi:hypothetical protein